MKRPKKALKKGIPRPKQFVADYEIWVSDLAESRDGEIKKN